jgi:hypothetical protein
VRSSHSHFVKVRGLRWISLHLLVPIPWAGHVWALPFLTALAPSERCSQRRHRRYKPLTLWARQLIRLVHRWQPDRPLVVVGDRTYAALELLSAVRAAATVVARLRLDAHLCAPAPPRRPRQTGRPRLVGARLPNLTTYVDDPATPWTTQTVARWYGERARPIQLLSGTAVWYHTGLPPVPIRWVLVRDPRDQFATQALLCTDLAADPLQIVSWFVLRWQLEVTFREVRAHLGVETQRQWSDKAILRTTPVLLGLYSIVILWTHDLAESRQLKPRTAAWYPKAVLTFSDAIAAVRREIWAHQISSMSRTHRDTIKIPRHIWHRMQNALAHAA